ncbi:MAG: metallophosphoesterase [Leptolyngbyaceae cyanobacterium]
MHPWLSGSLMVEQVTVPITGLPRSLVGTTLVQLSDFHFDGARLAPQLLEAAIAQSNAFAPDLVVLTGDFVTLETEPIYELATYLQRLQSRFGVYGVLGNHDDYTLSGRLMVIDGLHRANVAVLWNEIAYPFGADLPLVGLADLWSGESNPAILQQLSPDIPRLVMAHNPDAADQLTDWRVDLQLSGHSHGGQIVLPRLGPLPAVIRRMRPYIPRMIRQRVRYFSDECDRVMRHWEWASGLHQLGANQLYVNRGLGTYFPGRFRCSPELTVITLVAP